MITIETPTSKDDEIWEMDESDLVDNCIKDLLHIKILEKDPNILWQHSINIENAYPIYEIGWKEKFMKAYDRVKGLKNVFTVGRSGLFLHCNIDHSIIQAKELSSYIAEDRNKADWNEKSVEFQKAYARE